MAFRRISFLFLSFALLLALADCSPRSDRPAQDSAGDLKVVATTTIVGDVVRQVVGSAPVQVVTLLPVGTDPHSFQPTPQDAALIANAELIFANGAGLEEFLKPLLQNAGGHASLVYVSDGVKLLQSSEVESGSQVGATGNVTPGALQGDPHTWFDPNNLMIWTQNIQRALSQLDPAQASAYDANAQAYQAKLQDLDGWIRSQVAQIPPANRQLVTDHATFTYFAERYGFTQTGAVIPSYSTLAQPSAQELARLEENIRSLGVKAIFIGETVNPNLAEQVSQDTGIQLVRLYTGSLTAADGPAPTYLDFMRYNVSAIVAALK